MTASPDAARGLGVTTFCIVMIVLSTLAVILRIWSRYTSKKQKFWWDDWLAIASLPLVLASLSIHLLMVSAGLGHHVSQITMEKLTLFLKYSYASQFSYRTAITMPKYSALLFYVRVFRIRWDSVIFRTNIFIAASFCTAWLLVGIFLDVFTCAPMQKYWLPLVPGHCFNSFSRLLGTAIASVLIDVYITILPIPILWSLHTGRVRRIVLSGFFFCAYCVITCSLGRLIVLVQANKRFTTDVTWDRTAFVMWTTAETGISIISICLPNIVQLFRRAHQHGMTALFTRREYNAPGSGIERSKVALISSALVVGAKGGFWRIFGNDDINPKATVHRLVDNGIDTDTAGLYSVSASGQWQRSEERDLIALDRIHLRQDVSVREDEKWHVV